MTHRPIGVRTLLALAAVATMLAVVMASLLVATVVGQHARTNECSPVSAPVLCGQPLAGRAWSTRHKHP